MLISNHIMNSQDSNKAILPTTFKLIKLALIVAFVVLVVVFVVSHVTLVDYKISSSYETTKMRTKKEK